MGIWIVFVGCVLLNGAVFYFERKRHKLEIDICIIAMNHQRKEIDDLKQQLNEPE